jgi:hypothetical protein
VRAVDVARQQEVVLDGLVHGWMLDARAPAGDAEEVDLVFRRATAAHSREAWT